MKYKESKRLRGKLSKTFLCKELNDIVQNTSAEHLVTQRLYLGYHPTFCLKNKNEKILEPLFSEKFELINYIDSTSSPKKFYHKNILHIKKVEDNSQFLKQEKYINLDNFSKSVLKKKKIF